MSLTLEQAKEQLSIFVESAKNNLANDKDHYLLPVALISCGEELIAAGCPFRSDEEKHRVMKAVSELAKQKDADGLCLIIDGHYKRQKEEDYKEFVKDYAPGQLAKEGAPEAIT
jgi:predicted aconitase